MVVAMAGLLTACSVFGDRSGTEQVDYEVVERLADGVEIRRYPARLAVETTVSGATPGRPGNVAFRRLFAYIQGANDGGRDIAMTAPVETAASPGDAGRQIAMTAPVESSRSPDAYRMRFFLPASLALAAAPAPSDPEVRLVEVPSRTVAVLRFSGFGSASTVRARTAELLGVLENSAWRTEGGLSSMFYDPPWTLPFFRRNEAIVEVTAVGS